MYKIVVVSHDRIETLRNKTLATLRKYQMPSDLIFIFVAPDELDAYRSAFPDYKVLPGALGLQNQRNAVSAYFEEGEHLFCMDDDIMGFYTIDAQQKLVPLVDLHHFLCEGFLLAEDSGASLWGLYPVKNAQWLSRTVARGLVFCYGCSFGLINRKDVQIHLSLKEDYERSLKFYKRDGCVVRLNWVCPLQTYRKGKGGLQNYRTEEREEAACKALVSAYPDEVQIKRGKGRVDLMFKRGLATLQS